MGLPPFELDTIAELLARAAAEYESHGSNDYFVPTSEGNRSVIAATIEYGNQVLAESDRQRFGDWLERDGEIFIWDFWLMSYLAQRCRTVVVATGSPTGLSEAESGLVATLLDYLAANGDEFFESASGGRLGVLEGWISEKTLLKRAVEQDASWNPVFAQNDIDRETYASGGNPFREYDLRERKKTAVPKRPPFADDVRGDLLRHEEFKLRRAVVLSLYGHRTEAEWQNDYDRLAAYQFWGAITEIHASGHVEFGVLAEVLADCVYLGCLEQAKYLALLLNGSLRSGNVRMDNALPLYQWVVRICFAYFELDFEPSRFPVYALRKNLYAPEECFGEPVLNELAAHWRDPDLSPLSQQLIWLCDYYTRRTRAAKTSEPKTEFGNSWIPARLPIVILAWFRLRETLGLLNPAIDHPLMTARYARLYPPRPFFTDSLLERILARLRREELPALGDFDQLTLLEPKRWRIWPYSRESERYASVDLASRRAPGFALTTLLPKQWVERSLPEEVRFEEPETGTLFCFSAYQSTRTGISVADWAEVVLARFARSVPAADRVAERYPMPSQRWFAVAEEFRGADVAAADAQPRHHLVAAGKSHGSLLSLHVIAKPDVFATRREFYRWLIEWNVFLGEPEAVAVVAPQHQDIPGFNRIAPDASWTDAETQFEIGLRHYQVGGADKTLAAAWFARAADLDHGKSQFNLALQLKNGDGVPQDLAKALYWCKRARGRGVDRAAALLQELEATTRSAKPFWKIW